MAFVSRAQRKTGDYGSVATGEVVGPGAYGDPPEYSGDHGYAPFSSTTERQLGGGPVSTLYTPGPGAYRQKKSDLEVAGARRDVSSGAFVSGVSRLSVDTSTALRAPGPGAYTSGDTWIKNTHRFKVEPAARRVTFSRAPTAPSVPARGQSYGYEESGTGELILQRAPVQGHSGVGADTVGPCVYQPLLTAVKTQKTTDFQSSRSTRGIFTVNANPGPGEYCPKPQGQDIIMEVNDRAEVRAAARESARKGEEVAPDARAPLQMTSNFASRVPLQSSKPVNEETAVPGPGTYVHLTQFRTKSVPENHQFFGCSSRRTYEVDVQTQLAAPTYAVTPGPGRYDDTRTGFTTKLPGGAADAAPFRSSSRRFDGGKAKAPGPGQYDEENHAGFVNDMNKKVMSRNGVFGSTSERFGQGPGVVPGPAAPGPGTYESQAPGGSGEDGVTLARLRRKETAAFASSADRFNGAGTGSLPSTAAGSARAASADAAAGAALSRDGERASRGARVQVPPPGAYEVANLWRKTRDPRRRTESFMSKETRFQGPKTTSFIAPGPGTYEAAQPLRNPVAVQRSSFQSGSARFDSNRSVAPGPGMYESEDPNASMNKRSFNVTVDGVMW